MKLAVLADVHANLVALQAVTEHIESWRPDFVVLAGDLVNRGPRPAECLSFVQEKRLSEGWLWVRGNHEDYVISQSRMDAPHSGPVFEVHRASYWTYQQLGFDVSALEGMPFQQTLQDPAGGQVSIVHASMRGNRDGIYPDTTAEQLEEKLKLESARGENRLPGLICVGHTHRPVVRQLNGTLVVNVGSAGLPFDGDTRPAYAQCVWNRGRWNANIVRLDYDLKHAERDFYETGYAYDAGPLVDLVLIELRYAHSQLYGWSKRYQQRAAQGEISMRESVRQFLAG